MWIQHQCSLQLTKGHWTWTARAQCTESDRRHIDGTASDAHELRRQSEGWKPGEHRMTAQLLQIAQDQWRCTAICPRQKTATIAARCHVNQSYIWHAYTASGDQPHRRQPCNLEAVYLNYEACSKIEVGKHTQSVPDLWRSLLLIPYVMLWPWPLTLCIEQRWCDQTLCQILSKSNNLWLSYSEWNTENLGPVINGLQLFCGLWPIVYIDTRF